MRYRWLMRSGTLAFILTLGCCSVGCSKVKKANSPEHAIQLMEAAARDGKSDQYLALLPKRQREFVVKVKEMSKRIKDAQKTFNDAMDSQFGKGSDSLPSELPDIAEVMTEKDKNFHMEIVSQERKDDSTTTMKLKVTRTVDKKAGSTSTDSVDCTAIKEDDGWKLNLGNQEMGDSDVGEQFMNSMFDQQIKGLEQTTAEIKSGKFKSRLEAMKALSSHSIFKR
jgi:hypothetical protein